MAMFMRCTCFFAAISLSHTRREAKSIYNVNDALQIAIRLAEYDLIAAVDYFVRAAQINPQNSQLWSNVGVTYMRLGAVTCVVFSYDNTQQLYHLADDYFNQAFDLEPGGAWQQNYEDLKYFVPWDEPSTKPNLPQKHKIRKIPVVHIDDIYSDQEEMLKYATGDHPYILRGAMKKWDLNKFTVDYLERHFPDFKVDYYSTNMGSPDIVPIAVPLRAALADLTSQSTRYKHKPGRYMMMILDMAGWNAMLQMAEKPVLPFHFSTDDQWLHTCFNNDTNARDHFMVTTKWRMLLIGSPGAGMFNHADSLRTASYQAQVAGYKRWHLCSPENSPHIGVPGAVDAFNPDYKRFPAFLKASCLQSTVGPGDMIYYPHDWWHQTEITNETSVSLTGTIVDWNNHREVADEMEDVCVRSHNIPLHVNPDTCSSLKQRCFPAWESQYGVKPTGEDVCQIHAQALHAMQAPRVKAAGRNGDGRGERVGPVMGRYRR